jgi:hypothetical protein
MVGVSTHKKEQRPLTISAASAGTTVIATKTMFVRTCLKIRSFKTSNPLRDEPFMARIWQEANHRLSAEKPDVAKEITKIEAQRAKTRTRIERYFDAFETGALRTELCNEKVGSSTRGLRNSRLKSAS